MSIHIRSVTAPNGDLTDVAYFCSGGCYRDSFAADRMGDDGHWDTGGAFPAPEFPDYDVHCAECGVLIASPDKESPTVVNLIERPPILESTGQAEPVLAETDSEIDRWVSEAREFGEAAGKAAASYTLDGNSDVIERAKVLAMMRDGDPAAFDYLPRMPNLSGEFADDPTPQSLFEDVIGRAPELDSLSAESEDGGLVDALADAFDDGVSDTFGPTCEAELIAFCEPADAPAVDMDAHYTVAGYGHEKVAFRLVGRAGADVRAVMVGDDREHIVSVDDLTMIDESDYCAECGQIGCTHDGREREPEPTDDEISDALTWNPLGERQARVDRCEASEREVRIAALAAEMIENSCARCGSRDTRHSGYGRESQEQRYCNACDRHFQIFKME